jgi:hypothetical protein
MTTLLLVAALVFFIAALLLFIKEVFRDSDDDEITFEDLKNAAGSGHSITLTPEQCSYLYNRYKQDMAFRRVHDYRTK